MRIISRVGIVALNMAPNNVHAPPIDREQFIIQIAHEDPEDGRNVRVVTMTKAQNGVAGSLSIFPSNIFTQVGGYKVRGVYCSDDGMIRSDIRSISHDVYIADNMYCVHKFVSSVENPAFMAWKHESMAFSHEQTENLSEEQLLPWALRSEQIFMDAL